MLAKIGGSTSSAFCQAASSRAVARIAKTPRSTIEPGLLGERQGIRGRPIAPISDAASAASASKPATVRSSSRTIGWKKTLISPRSSARRRSPSSEGRSARCARIARLRNIRRDCRRLLGVGHRDLRVLEQFAAFGDEAADRRARADRDGQRDFPFAKADRRRQVVANRFDDFADAGFRHCRRS
jgi:hypothetical protein